MTKRRSKIRLSPEYHKAIVEYEALVVEYRALFVEWQKELLKTWGHRYGSRRRIDLYLRRVFLDRKMNQLRQKWKFVTIYVPMPIISPKLERWIRRGVYELHK